MLSIAQAARNSGGVVLGPVPKNCSKRHPRPEAGPDTGHSGGCSDHSQSGKPLPDIWRNLQILSYSGEVRTDAKPDCSMILDDRKVIARRAALELTRNSIIKPGYRNAGRGCLHCFGRRSIGRHHSNGRIRPDWWNPCWWF